MVESGGKVAESEGLDLHLSTINILSNMQNMDSFFPKFPQL